MLKHRVIARLDVKAPWLVKPLNCEGVRKVGDPAEFARRYDEAGIDEILFMDVVASLYRRNSLHDLVSRVSEGVFAPLCVGGGVRSVGDVRALLLAGADKAAINTAAIERPALIDEIARAFGSQALVIQIDAKRKGNGWEAYCDGARQPTGKDAVAWAHECVDRGAGEILVTGIDNEGTRRGFDLALVEQVSEVRVPVVASGGCGNAGHAVEAIKAGASGVALAHVLHYQVHTIQEMKRAMHEAGIAVRL